jgi:prepilin-type N-terminal cleavage/methylation domain-containing protein
MLHPTAHHPARRALRGFTLVELMIGIVMSGIILAAVLPGFRSMMEGYRHRNSVGEMTSRMYLVRQMAVRDHENYVMTVNPGAATFAAFCDANANGIADAGETQLGPWPLDTGISLQNLSWAGNRMTFFPNGTTSQTGDLRVFDGKGRSKQIRVSSLTGNVEVLP